MTIQDFFNQLVDAGFQHIWLVLMAVSGSVIAWFRAPQIKALASNLVSSLPSVPGKSSKGTPQALDVIGSMVANVNAITDKDLHAKAVEALVAFSETVIRQAAILEESNANSPK